MFYLYFIPGVIFSFCFLHTVTFFYIFSTLMSLKDRLRLKLKVKTEISLCIAIMLDNPWQSLQVNEKICTLEKEYRDCIKSRRDKIRITRHIMMHQVLYNVHVTLFIGQLHNI